MTRIISHESAFIAPPFGLNLFFLRETATEIPMGVVIRGSFPFMVTQVIVIVVCLFSRVWLPRPVADSLRPDEKKGTRASGSRAEHIAQGADKSFSKRMNHEKDQTISVS